MGKFFDEKFKKKHSKQCNCLECRGVQQPEIEVEDMIVDVEIDDPMEIVQEYYIAIKEDANTEEEVAGLLFQLFYEGTQFGIKNQLIDDIEQKIEELNSFQNGNQDK